MQVLIADCAGWPRQTPQTWQAESTRRDTYPFGRNPLAMSLGQLFDSAWQPANSSGANLKSACTTFVRSLRDDGRTPEQVLVALKQEITEHGALHLTPALCTPSPTERDRERTIAYERLFHWFLEAYFDENRFTDPGARPE